MKLKFFTAKDFHPSDHRRALWPDECAEQANAKLAKQQVVYACGYLWSADQKDCDTHKAYLVDIKPIEAEDFDFEPGALNFVHKHTTAQEIHDAWLEKQTVVYGNHPSDLTMNPYTREKKPTDTHRACLTGVTELHKECQHKPGYENMNIKSGVACLYCDVILKPTGWEPLDG